jgi:anti-sigma factor RsiW
MNPSEREPTQDELLAMAYADGELADEARRTFEERLQREPALAREVTALEKLDLLARHAVGPEPMDAEWGRLQHEPLQRAALGLGWSLLFVGGLTGAGWLVLALFRSGFSTPLKIVLAALLIGLVLLFLLTLRARRRTLPYDPYTDVKR